MKVRTVRVAIFTNAVAADLSTDINKFLNGIAVGIYPDDFIKEQELVSIEYAYNGTDYTALIAYTE